MINKSQIIKSEGVEVRVTPLGGTMYTTRALFGRATRQSNTMLSLETTKKAQFSPENEVGGGAIIRNVQTDEFFIVIADMKEVIRGSVVSTVCQMYNVNCQVSVRLETISADENGNKSTIFVPMLNSVGHIEYLSTELRSLGMGISKDAEYRVYVPEYNANILDKLVITVGPELLRLRVVSIDFVTYSGVTVIEACTETRK